MCYVDLAPHTLLSVFLENLNNPTSVNTERALQASGFSLLLWGSCHQQVSPHTWLSAAFLLSRGSLQTHRRLWEHNPDCLLCYTSPGVACLPPCLPLGRQGSPAGQFIHRTLRGRLQGTSSSVWKKQPFPPATFIWFSLSISLNFKLTTSILDWHNISLEWRVRE